MQNTINIEEIPSQTKKHGGGPRTEEGKKRSSQNSLRHGIFSKVALLPGETQEQFDQLYEGLIEEFKPQTTSETLLVRRLAENQWRAGRVLNAETEDSQKAREKGDSTDKVVEKYGRYSASLTREFVATLKTLKEQQAISFLAVSQEYRQAVLIRDYYNRQDIDWDPADDEFVFSKELLDRQLGYNQQWDRVIKKVHIYSTTRYMDERYLKKAL